jgi:phytoene dehydrogenase-like protein
VDGLAAIVERHGGRIVAGERVSNVAVEGDRVTAARGKLGTYDADTYVFCVPPKELVLLFAQTRVVPIFEEYQRYESTDVVVYDIGLERRILTPYTYIFNKPLRAYITDISHYDRTCIPPGGQLLQAVAYLSHSEAEQGGADAKVAAIEALYDKHFEGWREALVAKRISKRATVQEIKCSDDQRLIPVKLYSLANAFFAGDWCEGDGQLSELSFSSAYEASERIMRTHPRF